MAGNLTIRNAELVLPNRVVTGDLVVEGSLALGAAEYLTKPVERERLLAVTAAYARTG